MQKNYYGDIMDYVFDGIMVGLIMLALLPSILWILIMVKVAVEESALTFLFPNFNGEKPSWTVFRVLYLFFNVLAAIALPFGVSLCTGDIDHAIGGAVLLVFAAAVILPTVIQLVRGLLRKRKQKRDAELKAAQLKKQTDMIIQKRVHVIVDRKLGSVHPEHDDIVYAVNYGYINDYTGGDGEPQDAYVLGIDEPIDEFDGRVVAVIHRKNDIEDKWVVVADGVVPTDDEIRQKTEFMEKYFDTEILR